MMLNFHVLFNVKLLFAPRITPDDGIKWSEVKVNFLLCSIHLPIMLLKDGQIDKRKRDLRGKYCLLFSGSYLEEKGHFCFS